MTRRPFIMLPADLLHSDLSDPAVRLWAVVDDLARTDPDAVVTQAAVARLMRCTDRHLRRIVRELVDAGWLEVHRRGRHPAAYEPLRRARPQPVHNPGDRRRGDRTPMSGQARSRPDTDVRSTGPGYYYAREEEEGRLSVVGEQRSARAAARPRWCGDCDEATRLVDDGNAVRRCPSCHPLAVAPF